MDRPSLEAVATEWIVYGDSLQEAGDPRGQLVALSHAIDEGRSQADVRDAYIREHGVRLLGGAKQFLDKYKLDWRFCEIVNAEVHVGVDDDATAVVQALLDAPCASLLSHVTLCGHGAIGRDQLDLSPAVALLAATDRVKQVGLVDDRATQAKMLVSRDFEPDQNLVTFGTLEALWPKVDRLKIVCADSAQLELGAVDAPELHSFILHNLRFGDGWSGENNAVAERLAEATWPQLAEFELRLCETWMANTPDEVEPYVPVYSAEDGEYDDFDEGDIDGVNWTQQLAGLLGNLAKAPLRRLAFTSFYNGASLVTALSNAGLAKTLVELDLSHSELSDDHLDVWLQNPAPFKHVKRLVVDGTHVTEEAMAKLRALGVEVSKDESSPGAPYRYVVGQE